MKTERLPVDGAEIEGSPCWYMRLLLGPPDSVASPILEDTSGVNTCGKVVITFLTGKRQSYVLGPGQLLPIPLEVLGFSSYIDYIEAQRQGPCRVAAPFRIDMCPPAASYPAFDVVPFIRLAYVEHPHRLDDFRGTRGGADVIRVWDSKDLSAGSFSSAWIDVSDCESVTVRLDAASAATVAGSFSVECSALQDTDTDIYWEDNASALVAAEDLAAGGAVECAIVIEKVPDNLLRVKWTKSAGAGTATASAKISRRWR